MNRQRRGWLQHPAWGNTLGGFSWHWGFPSPPWGSPKPCKCSSEGSGVAALSHQQGGTGASCFFHCLQRGGGLCPPPSSCGALILTQTATAHSSGTTQALLLPLIPFWGTRGTCRAPCHTRPQLPSRVSGSVQRAWSPRAPQRAQLFIEGWCEAPPGSPGRRRSWGETTRGHQGARGPCCSHGSATAGTAQTPHPSSEGSAGPRGQRGLCSRASCAPEPPLHWLQPGLGSARVPCGCWGVGHCGTL